MSFNEITQEIQEMSFDEKIELHRLLKKYIIEESRNEIYLNYKNSRQQISEGKLQFTSDINELKRMLETNLSTSHC